MISSMTYRLLASLLVIAALHCYVAAALTIAPKEPPAPEPVTAKPGSCPPFFMKCMTTNDGCTSDQDCPDREKCCQVQCGPLSCTKPVFSAKCPAVKEGLACFRKDDDRCFTDSDCVAPTTTCCPTDCKGTQCISDSTAPAETDSNQCPPMPAELPKECAYTDYFPDCQVHSDCGSGLCCSNPDKCGVPTCNNPSEPVEPVDPVEPVKPETSQCPAMPAEKPEKCTYTRFASDCTENANCSAAAICCPNECGVPRCTTPSECPMRKCSPCANGYLTDSDGCRSCTCAEEPTNPCATYPCAPDQVCQANQVYCKTAPCPQPEPTCVPKPKECPMLKCSPCANGYLTGRNGCRTCTCAKEPTNPCATYLCPPDQVCEARQVNCFTTPCLPQPTCVPISTDGQSKCPPVIMIGCVNFTKPVDCKSDSECSAGQICCPIECDGAKCRDVTSPPQPADVCTLPADTGSCKALFPRWYFDRTAGKCMTFNWGGCLGNANNFEDEAGCQAKCQTKIAIVDPPPPVDGPAQDARCPAVQPGDVGTCAFMCGPDMACAVGKICCKTACGTSCLDSPTRTADNPPTKEKPGQGQGSPGNSGSGNPPSFAGDNGQPPREGTCPADRVRRKLSTDAACSTDDGCPGNKKCCSRAGDKVCRSPDAPKAGTCPNVIKTDAATPRV